MATDDRLGAFRPDENLERKRLYGRAFVAVCVLATLAGVVALALLLFDVVAEAWGWVSWTFLTHPPRFSWRTTSPADAAPASTPRWSVRSFSSR